MNELLSIVLICGVLGCVVGFLAGLLGIGGGLIIVPVLSVLLTSFKVVDAEQAMLIAIATSLASIIFTSTSSAIAHHKHGNIPWHIAPWVLIGVSLGALFSGFVATGIDHITLEWVFALCVFFIASRMTFPALQTASRPLPSGPIITGLTSVIGGLSGMIGIGGGALLVPFLNYFQIDMKKAIGCAALSGILIALFGTVGFIYAGWQFAALSNGFVGYVYLPALFGIVVTSAIFAQLGAKATQYLPVAMIKKIFALILVLVAIKMLLV